MPWSFYNSIFQIKNAKVYIKFLSDMNDSISIVQYRK